MIDNTEFEGIAFDLPKNQSNVIKVIGVGGGGSNAINHMFKAGINGVDFVVCNTDAQALQNSPVPNKIQLGISLTEGLGAGANPEIGEQAAIESSQEVISMLETTTKMVFITAGMGGGTGTGAAPVIAKQARDLDILTVGIVTTPFIFEGKMRSDQAQLGIEKLRKNVDSLIIINNNKLREVYGNLGFKAGFSKADEVLATAAKGIAEVITHHYTQNIDLRDAKTVLAESGTAIMGSAQASGDGRAQMAINSALDSPLLNDNKITGAKNVLLLIVSGTSEITIDEIGEINDHIQGEAGNSANIIMGVGEDVELGDAISVTVIATGFNPEQQHEIVNTEAKKIIHTLEDDQKAAVDLMPNATAKSIRDIECEAEVVQPEQVEEGVVKHTLVLEEDEEDIVFATDDELVETSSLIRDMDVVYETVDVVPQEALEMEVNEFEIIDTTEREEIHEIIAEEDEEQMSFFFDLSVDEAKGAKRISEEEKTTKYQLEDSLSNINVMEMEVIDAEIVVADTPDQEEEITSGEKRYVLDDYEALEHKLDRATAVQVSEEEVEVVTEAELKFAKKTIEIPEEETKKTDKDEIDPIDSPISDMLKERAAERRRTLKDFNYKFNNSMTRIDEIEKEPAYKRQGIELSDTVEDAKVSRTSLSTDSNDEDQLRTNNSFLHDNVD
jgi:cell division protein FtsZ